MAHAALAAHGPRGFAASHGRDLQAQQAIAERFANNPDYDTRLAQVKNFVDSLRMESFCQFWQFKDADGNLMATVVPCADVLVKTAIVLFYDKEHELYHLVNVIMPEKIMNMRFTNDQKREVDTLRILFEHHVGDSIQVVATDFKGGHFNWQREGYHEFCIGGMTLARMWVKPKEGAYQIPYRDQQYWIEFPKLSWYVPVKEGDSLAFNGYLPFVVSLLPRLHWIRYRHQNPPLHARSIR